MHLHEGYAGRVPLDGSRESPHTPADAKRRGVEGGCARGVGFGNGREQHAGAGAGQRKGATQMGNKPKHRSSTI